MRQAAHADISAIYLGRTCCRVKQGTIGTIVLRCCSKCRTVVSTVPFYIVRRGKQLPINPRRYNLDWLAVLASREKLRQLFYDVRPELDFFICPARNKRDNRIAVERYSPRSQSTEYNRAQCACFNTFTTCGFACLEFSSVRPLRVGAHCCSAWPSGRVPLWLLMPSIPDFFLAMPVSGPRCRKRL